jgi:hypothetical protein
LNIKDFINKEYTLPKNIPASTTHKYVEIIEKGYAKLLESIDRCGKFIMYKQFYNLIKIMDKSDITEDTIQKKARLIIKRLTELGFIETSKINKNKFLYLKKSSFAFAEGDYINNSRVNPASDMKNDRFQIAILKVEYMLKHGEIIHSSTMLNQLKYITNHIYQTIMKTGNQYLYDVDVIEQILELDDFGKIKELIEEKSEYNNKIGIIRGLWLNLGTFYKRLLLQKQTVTEKPTFFKLYLKKNGEIIVHYIPNIVIFDVSRDKKFYTEKSAKLFHAFYGIEGNDLNEIQKNYMEDRSSMGFQGKSHIGYKLTLIGSDKEILEEKKAVLDENINSSINSPLMDKAYVVDLSIGKYLYHASRKGNEYYTKQDQLISNIILKQLIKYSDSPIKEVMPKEPNTKTNSLNKTKPITNVRKANRVSVGQKILDLVNGD